MRMLPKWRIFSEPDPVPAEKAHPGDILLAEFFDKHFYPHAEATRRRPRIVKYVFDRHMRSGLGQIKLGSGLIDHIQKMTMAAIAMADMKVCAHRS